VESNKRGKPIRKTILAFNTNEFKTTVFKNLQKTFKKNFYNAARVLCKTALKSTCIDTTAKTIATSNAKN